MRSNPTDSHLTLKIFFDGDSDYYIAHSRGDARLLFVDLVGEQDAPDESVFTEHQGELFSVYEDEDATEITTKTVTDWVAEHGRGWFCGRPQ